MTKISRTQLRQQLGNGSIDLSRAREDPNIRAPGQRALRNADINGDGKIRGSAEADALFSQLDLGDNDGNYDSLVKTPEIRAMLQQIGGRDANAPVATVLRGDFLQQLAGQQLGVLNLLSADLPEAEKQAVTRADRNRDGQIRGRGENRALFAQLDRLDHDGSSRSMHRTQAIDDILASAEPIPSPLDEGRVMGVAQGTAYYPHSSALEGGHNDKRGRPLQTLQDYLNGDADYVSIALDKHLYRDGTIRYGDTFRIPELERRFGQPIRFKAVDTGGAFSHKGFDRVDICTGSYQDSLDPTINGPLTLIKTD